MTSFGSYVAQVMQCLKVWLFKFRFSSQSVLVSLGKTQDPKLPPMNVIGVRWLVVRGTV